MELSIRHAMPADLDGLCAVWNEAAEAGNAITAADLQEGDAAGTYFLREKKTAAAVDGETGEVLGFSCFSRKQGRCSHIAEGIWFVRSCSRGLRLDDQLVMDCMGRARAAGCTQLVFAEIPAVNSPAVKCLRKLGFAQNGSIPGGFRLPDGSMTDLLSFACRL